MALRAVAQRRGVFTTHAEVSALSRLVLIALAFILSGAQMVNPGDRNYPQVNRQPQRVLELRATIPSTLDIRFSVLYTATNSACTFLASSLSDHQPQVASVPVELHRDGKRATGQVPLDGVLPGRCGWEFRALVYRIAHGPISKEKEYLADQEIANTSDLRYQGPVDIWCSNSYRDLPDSSPRPWCSIWYVVATYKQRMMVRDGGDRPADREGSEPLRSVHDRDPSNHEDIGGALPRYRRAGGGFSALAIAVADSAPGQSAWVYG